MIGTISQDTMCSRFDQARSKLYVVLIYIELLLSELISKDTCWNLIYDLL